jgi:two-component system chemotaxis response regulator CheB
MTIRVLVVDDSALIRGVLQSIINEQSDMQVVGLAADARIARELVRELNPDVITLDVEMPGMDGLAFLQQLMQEMPKPVLMVSSHTQAGSDIAFRALEIGAVDFIAKPSLSAGGGQNYGDLIAEKIRAASRARLELHAPNRPFDALPALAAGSAEKARSVPPATPRVAFMGASTGGTEAIRAVLEGMPISCLPVLIVQHLPENFARPFAHRLDGLCQITVKEAEHGEPLLPGHAYIAPGNAHLTIRAAAVRRYIVELTHTGFVNLHRPSIDVLFGSAVKCMGSGAIGVMLSGMGKDGPTGMLELKQAGAHTIAQDENSSVMFGMSREAIRLGAVEEILPLSAIAARLCELATLPAASDA